LNGSSFLVFLVFLLSFHGLYAQKSKEQLNREKLTNIKRIKEAGKILKETQSKKESTLSQLELLKREIEARNDLINSISEEIDLINNHIKELSAITSSLENDVTNLKAEYAEMIYQASKSQSYFDKITFIFSAKTFNQLVMRMKYLKEFSDNRKYQVEQIEKVMATLAKEKVKLKIAWKEKNKLLLTKQAETNNLNQTIIQHDEMLASLEEKEKELKKEVAEREKENKKLEKLIADIVKREIRKARLEAERKAKEAKKYNTASKTTHNLKLTPEVSALSATFAANARKLPWPVKRGEIVSHFGKQPHPILKGVIVDNIGINILTIKDEPVRAVFKGKVVTIATVPGMDKVVMIQHGEYFTVYAKLKSVLVTNGQEVKAKEQIGSVVTDKDGQSQLQFQVWKNSEKMDPEKWLYRK